ncbi:MAG: RNA methyltransferase, partial [Pseudomonadota bacterium]
LLRTSQAVGGAGFIFVGDAIDPYAPEVVRASMGAIYQQRFVRATWSAVQKWVTKHECHVIGASPDGTNDLHQIPTFQNPLLVLGEERQGLTSEQRQLCSSSVRIPMEPGTDSLNLGVAGGLLLYEIYRQDRIANPQS